ncbi:MAG: hypothetical protein LV479_06410 [Methylacidiphilales bacterium]|nr:hypothetical protein [Candidatus Methylacidiphilales bacterium]
MKQNSLQILDKLVKIEAKRQRRLTDLIRSPETDCFDWFMFVPICFNAALDIQQTPRISKEPQSKLRGIFGGEPKLREKSRQASRNSTQEIKKKETLQWTQGSTFSFSAGDIIYDTKKAYEKWSNALKYIRYCFHITEAMPVTPANGLALRKPGKITFDLLIPNETRTNLLRSSRHDMNQDEFVRLLISGSSAQLSLSSFDTLL